MNCLVASNEFSSDITHQYPIQGPLNNEITTNYFQNMLDIDRVFIQKIEKNDRISDIIPSVHLKKLNVNGVLYIKRSVSASFSKCNLSLKNLIY